VALLARSREALESLAAECSQHQVRAHVIVCDLSSKESVDEACQQLANVFEKKLDLLINNAGIFGERISSIEEKTPSGIDVVDMWEEVMMVNLVQLMRLTGRCLPMMRTCQHGAVIAISSLAATVGKG
jgi:short-subunit dehydrogenase